MLKAFVLSEIRNILVNVICKLLELFYCTIDYDCIANRSYAMIV